MGEVIDMTTHAQARGGLRGERPDRHERQRMRWREAWARAAALEEGAGERKTLPLRERRAMARVLAGLVAEVRKSDGGRLGLVLGALERAAENIAQEGFWQQRGVSPKPAAIHRPPDYRLERFDGRDPDNLRGKLMDWLAVVEALGGALGRMPAQQVVRFLSDVEDELRGRPSRAGTGSLADAEMEVFEELAADLRRICAEVARRHDVASYYAFGERVLARWIDGRLAFNEGEFEGFRREDFDTGSWLDFDEFQPFWNSERTWGDLGPIGNVLVQVPLAIGGDWLPSVRLEERHPLLAGLDSASRGGRLSLEVEIALVLRADCEDSEEAGGLLIHPYIGWRPDGQAGTDLGGCSPRAPEVVWPSEELRAELRQAESRQAGLVRRWLRELALERCGQILIEPLSGETCERWLSIHCGEMQMDVETCFDWSPWKVEVSAPQQTLAGAIQRNLLTHDDAEDVGARLDRMLDRAAAERVAAAVRAMEEARAAWRARRQAGSGSSALPPLGEKEAE